MIRVHVHGAGGRMGCAAVAAVDAAEDLELCGTSGRDDDLAALLAEHRPDVVVEFTVPDAVERHLRAIVEAGCHAVSGTTGLAPDRAREVGELAAACGRGVLLAPNFAIGVLLLQRFAREAARWLPDVEIIELHHDQKLDAPSGTALHTARMLGESIGDPRVPSGDPSRGLVESGIPIHSVRLPGLLAHQEVLFGGPGQVLTLRHDTLDRGAFMPGVLLGIRRIGERTGLVDSLEPFLDA